MIIIEKIKNQFLDFFDLNIKTENNEAEKEDLEIHVESNFQLPIEYLENDKIHSLSEEVSNDLELAFPIEKESKSMYEILLDPEDSFSKQMIPNWNKYFTSDTEFLKETQNILRKMPEYQSNMMETKTMTNTSCILKIWKNTKENKYFLEKYNYMEWDMLKFLNEDSFFLQLLFCIHMASPLIQFLVPLMLLIIPFIILKFSGIPFTTKQYMTTLKVLASQHSIGKIFFASSGTIGWSSLAYLIFTIGMYMFQIYQNVNLCRRFYNNIIQLNDDLCNLKTYVNYSLKSIEEFMKISNNEKYAEFNEKTLSHYKVLQELETELISIDKFTLSLPKLTTVGYLLKMYYRVHSNKEYEQSIIYAMGFDGYVNNMCKLDTFLCNRTISFAKFSENSKTSFEGIYYPAIKESEIVINDVDMKKNKIISAPNKAGKTTLIKTILINIIFTQQFGCGFYTDANLRPYKYIHSYLNIPDTSGRDSLFQAESRRCKEIINKIVNNKNDNHFCIFDELYSGTNPEEAVQAGNAFIKYLEKFKNVDFILTTHYLDICKKFNNSKKTENCKMKVDVDEEGTFNYKYKLLKGVSNLKGGIKVLQDMEYPEEILNNLKEKSP